MTIASYRQITINVTAGLIAVGLICLLAYCTYALIHETVPNANNNALMVVIGILSANVATVINFFFGSSSNDKKSAETIDKLADTANAAQKAAAPKEPAISLQEGESVKVEAAENAAP